MTKDNLVESLWLQKLEASRKRKDEFFATDHESPLHHQAPSKFAGLKYFVPDQRYTIAAELQRYKSPETVTMVTSKGTKQRFHRVGYFEFEIDGKKLRLQAYRSAEREDNELFVPFKDGTSDKESYGASRYLDLDLTKDDNYVIDFNYAYNPYCAYSEDYVCPLPPRENWLGIEIRAGEKNYH